MKMLPVSRPLFLRSINVIVFRSKCHIGCYFATVSFTFTMFSKVVLFLQNDLLYELWSHQMAFLLSRITPNLKKSSTLSLYYVYVSVNEYFLFITERKDIPVKSNKKTGPAMQWAIELSCQPLNFKKKHKEQQRLPRKTKAPKQDYPKPPTQARTAKYRNLRGPKTLLPQSRS